MAGDLLTKWLTHYDPIHRGWTPSGIANGVCATNGYAFPRIRGGYNLRRAIGTPPDETEPIIGAAGADAGTIATFPWVQHASGTDYVYRLTAVNGGGVENTADHVSAETSFDASGSWAGLRPNAPGDLRIRPHGGGHFELRWTYAREGEQAEPASFRIYSDGGSGAIDFHLPVDTVPYRRGRFHLVYLSSSFPHATRVRWAVRAVSSAGVEDPGNLEGFAWSVAEAPPRRPVVVITEC